MIRANQRIITQDEIAACLNISHERVNHNIINKELKFHKICARWVPSMLTNEMKEKRVQISKEFLKRSRRESDSFLQSIVTGDETWVYHYESETKRQSMEYRHRNSPCIRKFKSVKSAGKVMLTIFRDARGVVQKEYMARGTTINSNSYCVTLRKLKKQNSEGSTYFHSLFAASRQRVSALQRSEE
ncbi:hypothetical protein PGB90_000967 [Kerria lacca]